MWKSGFGYTGINNICDEFDEFKIRVYILFENKRYVKSWSV